MGQQGGNQERLFCSFNLESHVLAHRWFCRLGLGDAVPDHSTFSKNRHCGFRESDLFRVVFEGVVERCMKAGLVGGEGFAVDASLIEADANRRRSMAREEVTDPRDARHGTRAPRDAFLLAAAAQNLRRMEKRLVPMAEGRSRRNVDRLRSDEDH